MGTVKAASDLFKQRHHALLEFSRLCGLKHVLELPQEEHLLLAIYDWPVLEQPPDDGIGKLVVLLDKLDNAIGELLVVDCDGLGLVQRDERASEEELVLLLHGQGEAVDYAAEDLEELADAVVALGLEYEAVEDIVDGLAYEWAVHHELAVDAVEHGLEVLALAGVLGVEVVEEAEHEGVVDVALGNLGVGVGGDDVAEQELVDEREVRPGGVEVGLLLVVRGGVGVDGGGGLVQRGGQRAEYVGGDGGPHYVHPCDSPGRRKKGKEKTFSPYILHLHYKGGGRRSNRNLRLAYAVGGLFFTRTISRKLLNKMPHRASASLFQELHTFFLCLLVGWCTKKKQSLGGSISRYFFKARTLGSTAASTNSSAPCHELCRDILC